MEAFMSLDKALARFEEALKGLEKISQAVGIPVEYTQGGGGNTSVKLDDELMAVKASGFKLKQINPQEGYVVVNYKNLKEYYNQVDLKQDRDFEKESGEFVKTNITEIEGLKKLRPSVEAGFHSILKKYVIHTHPVYANILCCSQNGRELVEKLFEGREYAAAWVPYINPGFCLTLKINEAIKASMESCGRFPQVIFMENHGLIVTDDDPDRCISLHGEVNDIIRQHFSLTEQFPEIKLVKLEENSWLSKTGYISAYLQKNRVTEEFFEYNPLYPDQLVYLNANMGSGGTEKKIGIDAKKGEVLYKTGFSEAQTFEETMLAYFYVLDGIKSNSLPLKTMTARDIDFIRNWESEAYRRSLVKELGK